MAACMSASCWAKSMAIRLPPSEARRPGAPPRPSACRPTPGPRWRCGAAPGAWPRTGTRPAARSSALRAMPACTSVAHLLPGPHGPLDDLEPLPVLGVGPGQLLQLPLGRLPGAALVLQRLRQGPGQGVDPVPEPVPDGELDAELRSRVNRVPEAAGPADRGQRLAGLGVGDGWLRPEGLQVRLGHVPGGDGLGVRVRRARLREAAAPGAVLALDAELLGALLGAPPQQWSQVFHPLLPQHPHRHRRPAARQRLHGHRARRIPVDTGVARAVPGVDRLVAAHRVSLSSWTSTYSLRFSRASRDTRRPVPG